MRLQVECDPKALGDSAASSAPAQITIYNGELVSPAGRGSPASVHWNYRNGEPLVLELRRAKPRAWKTDRTVLQFRLPAGGAFGVAVDDVLAQGQVYVKCFGTYVSRSPAAVTFEQYRKQIAGGKTVLEEVRHLPDQVLEEAIKHIHNPRQDLWPTMLSLACENQKFASCIAAAPSSSRRRRKSRARWNIGWTTKAWPSWSPSSATVRTRGSSSLDGGWMPIVVNEVRNSGLVYTQKTFVVPLEELPLPEPGWLSPHPMCVAEFSIENTKGEPAPAALGLTLGFVAPGITPEARTEGSRVCLSQGSRLVACVDQAEASCVKLALNGGTLSWTGDIPAGQTAKVFVYLPGWVLDVKDQAQLAGGGKLVDRCKAYWEHVMAPAAKVTIPDPLLMNTIKASQVHCLIAARSEADGQRVAPWIASTYYGPLESEANSILRGMDFLGHHEFARRGHDYFLHRYNPAGFLTTGYTLMGTGWQLWCLGEHYELAHDAAWLQKVAPGGRTGLQMDHGPGRENQAGRPDGSSNPSTASCPPVSSPTGTPTPITSV